MTILFTKMHANRNDFVLIDERETDEIKDKAEFAEKYCDRHRGIGGNGVLFLDESNAADIEMRLFQPDGSEAEMCGNAVRCIAQYLIDEKDNDVVSIETKAGIKEVEHRNGVFSVDMGVPKFESAQIPSRDEVRETDIAGYQVTACNTGVPHAVCFVDKIDDIDIDKEAPDIRYSELFPEGANVDFVEKEAGSSRYKVRTYERGVEGETFSCGTGAVAAASVSRLLGEQSDRIDIETKGGELVVEFSGDTAYLIGYAEEIYRGEIKSS